MEKKYFDNMSILEKIKENKRLLILFKTDHNKRKSL